MYNNTMDPGYIRRRPLCGANKELLAEYVSPNIRGYVDYTGCMRTTTVRGPSWITLAAYVACHCVGRPTTEETLPDRQNSPEDCNNITLWILAIYAEDHCAGRARSC